MRPLWAIADDYERVRDTPVTHQGGCRWERHKARTGLESLESACDCSAFYVRYVRLLQLKEELLEVVLADTNRRTP